MKGESLNTTRPVCEGTRDHNSEPDVDTKQADEKLIVSYFCYYGLSPVWPKDVLLSEFKEVLYQDSAGKIECEVPASVGADTAEIVSS